LGNQIKENEMGRASGTYRGEEKCIENSKERTWNGVNCVETTQDDKKWWTVVNTVVILWLPYNAGVS
jgi:hypothetical protein